MRECKWCGKSFEHKSKIKLYCSPECYNEANKQRARKRNTGIKAIDKKCVCCGKDFVQNGHKQIYCSPECRKEMNKSSIRLQRDIKPKKKKVSSLWDLNRLAREHGMSYGQYVAYMQKGAT